MEEQYAVSVVTLAIIALTPTIGVILNFIGLIRVARRTPPLTEELYRDFVRRPELLHLEARWDRERAELRTTIKGIFDKIDQSARTTSRSFTDIERAIGRVEGEIRKHLQDGP